MARKPVISESTEHHLFQKGKDVIRSIAAYFHNCVTVADANRYIRSRNSRSNWYLSKGSGNRRIVFDRIRCFANIKCHLSQSV